MVQRQFSQQTKNPLIPYIEKTKIKAKIFYSNKKDIGQPIKKPKRSKKDVIKIWLFLARGKAISSRKIAI